ncbi:invasion-associated locus B family protein [Salipiger pallidus]|uniref:Invasion-associated locus B family protein n=2 Tax=Salipiger pallidus TaxID=1775170 RepID=A0A8J2ZG86_9RHOB|nr:invasion-associated locus B family protein [Salipiger pallidus]
MLWALPLMASLGAAPALAQDATEGAEGATTEAPASGDTEAPESGGTEAPAGGSNIGGPLSMGEAEGNTGAAKGGPESYIKETHGDWQLQCLRVPEGSDAEDPCQMYQLLKDSEGNNVAEVSMFRLSNGGQVSGGGTFVVPLETLLTQKLAISVDGGQAKRYDFSFCTRIGCYARVGFSQEDIARFKGGAESTIRIIPALAPDQTVELTMSLSGFTAAYDETTALRQ